MDNDYTKNKDSVEIEFYLNKDLDELYYIISDYETKSYINIDPLKQLNDGKRFFKKLEPTIYNKLCVQGKICEKLNDPLLQDTINLAIVIIDIIPQNNLQGVPPALIASIIIKIGLQRFCKCNSMKKN